MKVSRGAVSFEFKFECLGLANAIIELFLAPPFSDAWMASLFLPTSPFCSPLLPPMGLSDRICELETGIRIRPTFAEFAPPFQRAQCICQFGENLHSFCKCGPNLMPYHPSSQ